MSNLDVFRFVTTHPMNRGAALKAVVRFAKWQIGSRLVGGDIIHEWVNGSKFLVRTGETGLTGNIYAGLHEFSDMGFLLHVLRAQDMFIDVGANVGSYSILAGKAVGARGYAFEPVPATYGRLVDNIRLNHLENTIRCVNAGLGRASATIKFTNDLDTVNHAIADGEYHTNTISVAITTMDDVLCEVHPSLIKIDVEGYETQVLQGAAETLKKGNLHSVILELNGSGKRYGYRESDILSMMSAHGFKTYSYDPFSRILTDLDGKTLRAGNTLFIRDKALVMERVASAPAIRLLDKQF